MGGESRDYTNLDSIEIYDEETETWKMSDDKLSLARHSFGHVKVSRTLTFD